MAEQHDKILALLGLSKDQIKKLNELTAEELQQFKEGDYTSPLMETLQTKFLNDNEFLKKISADKLPADVVKGIESKQYGRFMNELREVATGDLGLKLDEFSQEEKDSLKKFFRKANQDYVTQKAGSTKGLTELQKQLSDALAAKDAAEQAAQQKVTDAVTAEKTKASAMMERLLMKSYLTSIKGHTLKANPDYIIDAVLNKVKQQYSPVVNDDQTISINQKDNPQLKVLKADGKEKTLDEALLEILDTDGMLEKQQQQSGGSNGQQDGGVQRIQVNGGNEPYKVPNYIQNQIDKQIALDKAAGMQNGSR